METFNASFYATAATVIPLLYLALLTSSSWFIKTFVSIEKGEQRIIKKEWPRQKVLGSLLDRVITIIAKGIFWVVFFAGSVGEISAIIALDKRFATPMEHKFVVISLYVLVVWVTLSSFAAIARRNNGK